MATYRNVMEEIVEQKYEELKSTLNCCTCERCHLDVIAYALNKLPPKYVVSNAGELYTKVRLLNDQYRIPILSALAEGSAIVRDHPNHVLQKWE